MAHDHGAIGCILYTDPADYSIEGVNPYPESWWLPETGVQRGTVFPYEGDPLTPGYPSIGTCDFNSVVLEIVTVQVEPTL